MRFTAASLLVSCVLGACTSTRRPHGSDDGASIPRLITRPSHDVATPAPDDHVAWSSKLPVAPYEYSLHDTTEQQTAVNTLVERCADRYGYTVHLFAPSYAQLLVVDSRRYGVTSEADAEKFGYQLPATSGNHVDPSASEELVLAGPPVRRGTKPDPDLTVHGRRVLATGCFGAAYAALGIDEAFDDQAARIKATSFRLSLTDRAVQAAFSRWSRCMKAKGYVYGNPLDSAGDPRWSDRGIEAQRAAAVTDVGCARRTGVDSVWLAAEQRIEIPLVRDNLQALQKERLLRASEQKTVRRVLGR